MLEGSAYYEYKTIKIILHANTKKYLHEKASNRHTTWILLSVFLRNTDSVKASSTNEADLRKGLQCHVQDTLQKPLPTDFQGQSFSSMLSLPFSNETVWHWVMIFPQNSYFQVVNCLHQYCPREFENLNFRNFFVYTMVFIRGGWRRNLYTF